MRIRYFAWMSDHTGCSEEEVSLPDGIETVEGLVDYLRGRTAGHARVLEDMGVVRVAVNLRYGGLDSVVRDEDEVAFFPPVTGG